MTTVQPAAVQAGNAPPAAPDADSPPSREMRPLESNRLKLLHSSEADYGNIWGATLRAETPLSDVTMPEFWGNHAHRIRAYDEIWINWDDGKGKAKGHVRQVSGAGTTMSRAVVAIDSYVDYSAIPRPPRHAATHVIDFRGPHLKHVIVRLADDQVVAEGLTEQAAGAMLASIIRHQPKA